jgi:hypothetical protein
VRWGGGVHTHALDNSSTNIAWPANSCLIQALYAAVCDILSQVLHL